VASGQVRHIHPFLLRTHICPFSSDDIVYEEILKIDIENLGCENEADALAKAGLDLNSTVKEVELMATDSAKLHTLLCHYGNHRKI
jgi:hypothetical protein